LQELPAAFRSHINEVLLSALARCLAEWTGSNRLLLDLEAHGREDILEGADLSRTVGWFTAVFPLLLDLPVAGSPAAALRAAKEQLRGVPHHGIGYGLLRYTKEDRGLRSRLGAQLAAELRFNYLGQADRALPDNALIKLARDSSGPAQSRKGNRAYVLNVIAAVRDSRLEVEWSYSENLHHRQTIESLAENHLEQLRRLIACSGSDDSASLVPSDFPGALLNRDDLARVLARLSAT
jgi:non-ribosomal peptide synthase protein (TIGR01720 family)